jgi:hypothetical protein
MSFLEDTKTNLKEGIRDKFEDATGIVGQALKARRERTEEQKRIQKEVTEIRATTTRIRSNERALAKIESGVLSISKNLRIINHWADAGIESQDASDKTAKLIRKEAQASKPDIKKATKIDKEDDINFGGVLDVLSNAGKLKFPKVTKKGLIKGALIGAAVIGAAAVVAQSAKVSEEPPPAPPSPPPPPPPVAPPPPPPPPPPPKPVVPPPPPPPPPPPKPAAPPPPPPPPPKPVAPPPPPPPPAAPKPTPPPPPKPAAPKPTPAALQKPTELPIDIAKAPPANKPESVAEKLAPTTAQTSSVPALSSSVRLDPGVGLAGMNSTFEGRVAAMAAAFKQQTGKTLLVTSGIRTNEKQKELYDAKVAQLKGNEAKARMEVAEPMPPLGRGKGSFHLTARGGLAIDINSKGADGLNVLAGPRDAPTGWLEKFGLSRPVGPPNSKNEDWHIQMASTAPVGDVGAVPGKQGNPIDPSTGKAIAVPTDPSSGRSLLDTSKSVDQLKRENEQPGQTTIVVTNTTNRTVYDKKKQPQGQSVAAVG